MQKRFIQINGYSADCADKSAFSIPAFPVILKIIIRAFVAILYVRSSVHSAYKDSAPTELAGKRNFVFIC